MSSCQDVIQLTLLHTTLVSILYILPRLTQLGLYKGFSMSLILLSLYFSAKTRIYIISPSLVLLHWSCEALLVVLTGFEPTTNGLWVHWSDQLSYKTFVNNCWNVWIRTKDTTVKVLCVNQLHHISIFAENCGLDPHPNKRTSCLTDSP